MKIPLSLPLSALCLGIALGALSSNAHAALQGWWKFDEASGTSAADASGLAPANGTLTGGATFQSAAGRFGGAVYLDGTTGYVTMGDIARLEFPAAQSYTLSCWYKPDGDETAAEFQTNNGLMTKGYGLNLGTPAYDSAGYYLMTVYWTTGAGNTTSFFQFDSRQSSAAVTPFRFVTVYQTPDAVVNATWKHFVTVVDRAGAQVRTYVDGTLYSTKAIVAGAGGGQWDMGVNASAFIVGNHLARHTKGWFDDVGVWNQALTPAEITNIYSNGIAGLGDTDGDGLPDVWETTYFGAGNLTQNGAGDFEPDGLTNAQELAYGTNPTLSDTDGDGLSDSAEVNTHLTNPAVADTDGDGLSDGAEVTTHGTNPLLADTDGDNYSDGVEIAAGTNPLLASSFPLPAAYNVHINEFMANSSPKANDATAPLDMDGDSGDWIEIRNNEAVAVNLQGYQLSDNLALPAKYTLPSFSIPAGGYGIVYASDKNRRVNGVQPHTNFQLSGSGKILLSRPSGGGDVVVSQIGTDPVPYPGQHRTISYGPPDNASATAPAYMTTATPGAANNAASVITGFVSDTAFSVDRGIYSASFSTTISCPTPGATIVYTVNGSVPTATNGTQIAPLDALTPPSGAVNIAATTLIRARAIKTGLAPSDTDTQSYIFTADVMSQNAPTPSMGLTGPETMAWGTTGADLSNITAFPGLTFWGINTAIAADAVPDNQFVENDLKNIATVSIVASWKELFGPSAVSGDGGIYPPATGVLNEGIDRAASMELINPDGSVATPNLAQGFQTDGNMHVFGGTSQNRWKSYKLSFRFQCLNDVSYRVYGDAGFNQFDNFVLDSRMNNTWMHPTDVNQRNRGDYVNDQVVADLQNRMSGRGGFRSRPVHLYINGLYWGVYSLHEKPDHHFTSAYYGGDSALWDVFKHSLRPAFTESDPLVNASYVNPALPISKPTVANPTGNSTVQANFEAMLDLLGAGYVAPNPAPDLTVQANYAAAAAKLEIDDFIDYMMVNFVGGNQDWSDKNLYASYYRGGGGKWRFHSWDAEHTFRTGTENFITALGNESNPPGTGQPKTMHNRLKVNAEYKLKFADHIRKHMFNGGALTPAGMTDAFTDHLNLLDSAIRAESARWGHIRASLNGNVAYKKSNWLTRKNSLLVNEGAGTSLLQNRWNLVMAAGTGIFRAEGLYPTTAAPDFSQHGGSVPGGYSLAITNPNGSGTTYYTLDGTDPRLTGGAVNGTAQTYSAPITLGTSFTVRSRVLLGGVWSALNEAFFSVGTVPASAANLVISEFNYNPGNPSGAEITAGFADANDFEYIEITNISANIVDLTGCRFTSGVSYTFDNGSIRELAPGGKLIVAENPAGLAFRHGGGLPITGGFELNTNLSNQGERLTLLAANDVAIKDFTYNDNAPWPANADGLGYSLVLIAPSTNPDHSLPESWRASATATNGTPAGSDISGYALWKSAHGITDDFADGDLDGFANVIEYLFGTDPALAAAAPGVSAAIVPLTIGGVPGSYFTFTFTHAAARDDVSYRVEFSSDLSVWSSATSAVRRVSIVSNLDGTVTETWRSAAPASGDRAFAHIAVSVP